MRHPYDDPRTVYLGLRVEIPYCVKSTDDSLVEIVRTNAIIPLQGIVKKLFDSIYYFLHNTL